MKRAFIIVLCCAAVGVHGQRSPFTGRDVVPPDDGGSYRLVFGGHFHGASHGSNGFPAATVLAGIDTINALRANALLSTGDLFLDAERDRGRYERAFFSKLDVALFNAPGNHDVEWSGYERQYGPTFGVLPMGRDRVVWLDTERDNGSLKGRQLDLLRQEVEAFEGRNLFIVSHRPLWAEDDRTYSRLFQGNTRSLLQGNFRDEVYPLLEKAAGKGRVYWISGSMAGRAPSSIFFQPHAPNITYVQCAVRDLLRDALLVVDVDPDTLHWRGVSLTGSGLGPVHLYDAAWWKAHQRAAEPFKWRLLPYLVLNTLKSAEFWYGVSTVLFLFLLIRVVRRSHRR